MIWPDRVGEWPAIATIRNPRHPGSGPVYHRGALVSGRSLKSFGTTGLRDFLKVSCFANT